MFGVCVLQGFDSHLNMEQMNKVGLAWAQAACALCSLPTGCHVPCPPCRLLLYNPMHHDALGPTK